MKIIQEDNQNNIYYYNGIDQVPKDVVNIIVEDGVEVIKDYAFKNCRLLKTIKLPDSLHTIGVEAFNSCTSLENIDLPNLLTIKDYAFAHCNLKSIKLPNYLTNLGFGVFKDCTYLESVDMSECVMIKDILPKTFDYCESLKIIKLPKNLQTIGSHAFAQCYSLEYIEFPESLGSIDYCAFEECESLKKLVIPETNRINYRTFSYCTNLRSVELLGDYLYHIDAEAFKECSSLRKINFPSSLMDIDNSAFENCNKLTAYIPEDDDYLKNYCIKNNIDYDYI